MPSRRSQRLSSLRTTRPAAFSPSLLQPTPVHKLPARLPKVPTGIRGFDEVSGGGLPKGRPTLVTGAAGCGKTVFATEFLVRGARDFGENGVFVSFEESPQELRENFAPLGLDLATLERQGKIFIEHFVVNASEQIETGAYDLEGLFVRLNDSVQRVGAKRIVLDTLESLFSHFKEPALIRGEFQRLFRWLKEQGLTAIVTAERGDGPGLTRSGMEEYVADAVVQLDHRVHEQVPTRRLRIVKYRGSLHGTNEYPFLIDSEGISVLPVTSAGLSHRVSRERVSTGIPTLDQMLGRRGFYRGSSILVSGTPGSGKTSLAAHFIDAACRRGERVLMFAFEESPAQVFRNVRSIGLDLEQWQDQGLLRIIAARPSMFGLETHLAVLYRSVRDEAPAVVVVDPLTDLQPIGTAAEIRGMTTRLVDFLKSRGTTALFTAQSVDEARPGAIEMAVSSLMDTWIDVRSSEIQGERMRSVVVIKSRGMAHSREIRRVTIGRRGIVVEPDRVITPSLTLSQPVGSAVLRRGSG